jgi:hypothetical protein
MPGLLRGVARTAVVAGTATAVSNRVSRRQAGRWANQQQESQPAEPQPRYEEQAYEPDPAEAAPEDTMTDKLAQLQKLGELKSSGVLTQAEFDEQKQRILG